MSQMNKTSIPVQMGSKKFQINYEYTFNDFSLNVEQLIKMVLMKLYPKNDRLDELIKTYRVFENAFGVERLVKKNENILNLLSNQNQLGSNAYFVVRKRSQRVKICSQRTMSARKCFEKFKIQKKHQSQLEVVDDQDKKKTFNLYVHDLDRTTIKEAFMNKILENEILLEQQIKQIDCLEEIIEQKKDNKNKNNFFQSICSKLRQQNKSKRGDLNQSSMYLIDSAGESSSASSSRNSSSSKLDTLF